MSRTSAVERDHDPGRQHTTDSGQLSNHTPVGRVEHTRWAPKGMRAAWPLARTSNRVYLNTYSIDHVFWSWTRFFMTMMSAATMTVVMLTFMLGMYRNRMVNAVIVVGAVVVFGAGLALVRTQATIGDVAWMRAMIPHHSIAILTSERAHLEDPRVRELADSIIEAQRKEIEEMKAYIKELE